MDANHVETLARTLPSGTRRRAVRLLAGVPLAGILTALAGSSETAHAAKSKGSDHRRRKRNRRGQHPTTPPHPSGGSCPESTCPPDARFAAVEACWDTPGVPVRGDCSCAWIDGVLDATLYPCDGRCVCLRTVEGAGFCGAAPPLSDPTPCSSSADCPLLPGLPERACISQVDGEPFCWFACDGGR